MNSILRASLRNVSVREGNTQNSLVLFPLIRSAISSYKGGGQIRKHKNKIWPAWPSEYSSKEREHKTHAAKQDTKTRHTDWNGFIHRCNTQPWMSAHIKWISSPNNTGPRWEKHG
eukprot:1159595-Pelagomonas_calceolata.AAC.1